MSDVDVENLLRVIRELEAELARYKKLAENLDRTADWEFVVECEHLYCPQCGEEVRQEYDICYCDSCSNRDDFNEPPLPMLYTMTLAKPPKRGTDERTRCGDGGAVGPAAPHPAVLGAGDSVTEDI